MVYYIYTQNLSTATKEEMMAELTDDLYFSMVVELFGRGGMRLSPSFNAATLYTHGPAIMRRHQELLPQFVLRACQEGDLERGDKPRNGQSRRYGLPPPERRRKRLEELRAIFRAGREQAEADRAEDQRQFLRRIHRTPPPRRKEPI